MLSQDIIPLQISYKKACQMLDVSRDTLSVETHHFLNQLNTVKQGKHLCSLVMPNWWNGITKERRNRELSKYMVHKTTSFRVFS